jgi:hypothetical protein
MENRKLFKNWKEGLAFVIMNITGAPLTWIALAVLINWWAVLGCVVVFFISWAAWKHFGGHKDAKLRIRPRISFVK